ncbi:MULTISPECIES: ketopantoate reductase family protein [Haloarcula]|uniref:2-dehydropantoate 2-reductase n=1 Tax=Haloarcula pellucida TaxID=1427151 RepID=A0A830GJV9_9EURY|nr:MULTISPECIES: 2-dehydropantoate 2-reductase [Halomicroarcula]MBX0350455.1 2-dehydropantoate 2-reductase [Halomicroarcula pellucida]MDS0278705.1 2-dehydropantoate 2-reductase [Halomicroarcula sp. S1AR25-4]GGN91114.1 2-dehydropantoate 2-reductase [Halomicroarcula pellucida]
MHIAVVGAGSLGTLLGGLLAREHDVTLVGREPHVGTVEREGLDVVGAESVHVDPAADTDPPDSADLALVAVKSYDTADAAAALTDCSLDACLSVQNGMGNESTLAAELDCPVLAGTCTYGARLADPGRVEFTGRGEVVLGAREGGPSTLADDVGAAFDAAGVETTVATDMPTRLWEKLAVNAAINATTALARVENGALTAGPGRELAADAARETARVAREQGVNLSNERAISLARRVSRDTAANRSSMLQDVEAGRRTEIDAINGYVVEHGEGTVPVNETLTRLLRLWEAGDEGDEQS